MKKIALVFLLAVFVPSLVLAWLAVLSARDQQLVLERQESLLCQGVADALAKDADNFLAQQQQEFSREVEKLRTASKPAELNTAFDERLRTNWPEAQVGFVVTQGCMLTSPSPNGGPRWRRGVFRGQRQVFSPTFRPPRFTREILKIPAVRRTARGDNASGK